MARSNNKRGRVREGHWKRVLDDAETSIKNMYASTFFARRHISIVDQQTRCLHLCRALSESGKITTSTRIAIIGASYSGMMCAVALAMRHDCIIHVFERDGELLKRFREGGFRYIHPNLHDRARDILSSEKHKETDFPFMNWSGHYAPVVAAQLIAKFDHYRRHTNIALHLNCEVFGVEADSNQVILNLGANARLRSDLCILATGFGLESRSGLTSDTSYWHSGNPEFYEPVARAFSRRRDRVLLSGNGDSAVIELAHYLLKEFDHENLLRLLPSEDLMLIFGDHYAHAVNALEHRQIEGGIRRHPWVPPWVSWYWAKRDKVVGLEKADRTRYFGSGPIGRMTRKLFDVIDGRLSRFNSGISPYPQLVLEIEKEIEELFSALASYEIAEMVRNLNLKYILSNLPAAISRNVRRNVPITVLGKTPTIYSLRQAPLNWFVLAILERYGKFKYIQGRFIRAKREGGTFIARVEVGGKIKAMRFERIVIRHGPDYRSFREQVVKGKFPEGFYRPDYGSVSSRPDPRGRGSANAALIAFFRTKRWQRVASIPLALSEVGSAEVTLGQRRDEYANVDYRFLMLNALHERSRAWYASSSEPDMNPFSPAPLSIMSVVYAEAEALFRSYKRSRSVPRRRQYASEILSLEFEGSLNFPRRRLEQKRQRMGRSPEESASAAQQEAASAD
jgi:hypothetical protein